MKAKCLRKADFQLKIQFVCPYINYISQKVIPMLSLYPPWKIKLFIFPTNEMSDFTDMNFCAGLSFYVDFRQSDWSAENTWWLNPFISFELADAREVKKSSCNGFMAD